MEWICCFLLSGRQDRGNRGGRGGALFTLCQGSQLWTTPEKFWKKYIFLENLRKLSNFGKFYIQFGKLWVFDASKCLKWLFYRPLTNQPIVLFCLSVCLQSCFCSMIYLKIVFPRNFRMCTSWLALIFTKILKRFRHFYRQLQFVFNSIVCY